MAKEDKLLDSGTGEVISVDAPMPEPEPGHRGFRDGRGEIFDPNAALRLANDVGPGMQDSERNNPAWWGDVDSAGVAVARLEAQVKALEKEKERVQAQIKELQHPGAAEAAESKAVASKSA